MTEQEALQKWCPFARIPYDYSVSDNFTVIPVNRTSTEAPIGKCVGSRCMAWRLNLDAEGNGYGYCGLAGRDNG